MPKITKISVKYFLFALIFLFSAGINAQDKVQKIDELVQKYYRLGQFNGAVLVAEDGNVIYSKGVGYADMENKIPNNEDTKFRLASVSKQFTATLIMQLVEKGKIKLEDNLSVYLPYYRKDVGEKITIAQILSHTSGLANYTDDPKFMQEETDKKAVPKDFVLKYCSEDLVFEPGTKWQYSNSGYFILGLVIEEVTGKTYEENLQENIFKPLGMVNSGVEHSDMTYENKAKGYSSSFGEYKPAKYIDMTVPFSAGSIYSTTGDMFKWDQALYTEKILSNASKEKMFTPVLNRYGYGWQIIEQPVEELNLKVITHSGGIFGFNSLETRLVDDNKFIMVLNNFDNGNLNQLTYGIVCILYGKKVDEPKKSAAVELSKLIKEKGIKPALEEFSKMKDNKKEYLIMEREMNQLGYFLLQDGKISEAVSVFKLNVDLYPESGNVYDSYAEALAASGDKEGAIKNYRKSVELDPGNVHGAEELKKLEGN